MTAPLEVLREKLRRAVEQSKSVPLTWSEAGAAIAAIDERDAEIATLTRQLAEARVELEREASAADRLHRERDEATAQRDAMRVALEEIRASARECSAEAGVLLAPDWIVEQCDRALGAL